MSFEFVGKKFDVVLSYVKELEEFSDDTCLVSIQVKSEGRDAAILTGKIKLDALNHRQEFFSLGLGNSGVFYDKQLKIRTKADHVPGLVGETIKQLICNEIFYKWTSSDSDGLSKGANIMYKRLSSEKDVIVGKIFVRSRPNWLLRTLNLVEDANYYYTVSKR